MNDEAPRRRRRTGNRPVTHPRRTQRIRFALERKEARAARTPAEQLAVLDERYETATRERARLTALLPPTETPA